MRILNIDNDIKVDKIGIFLTMSEAKTMKSELERLILNPPFNHSHITSNEMHKEITIAIYDEDKIEDYGFNDRSKKLIHEDV